LLALCHFPASLVQIRNRNPIINRGTVHHFDVPLNYDELLNRKIKLEYEKMNPDTNPNDDLVRKKEKKINDTILAFENGISHQELADIIDIDRNNLRPYTKRLMRKGLVTRERGKQGKYYPTTKTRRGISLTADILANSFISNILDKDNFPIDIPSLNAYRTELELELLRLSNIIGRFIIYVLIQSWNSENKIAQGSRNVKEKAIGIQTWLEDTMSILVRDISSIFFSRVYPHVYPDLESTDGDIPLNPSDEYLHSNEFFKKAVKLSQQTVVSELTNCFSNLFPNLSLELEKTRSKLPELLAQEIKHIKDVAEKRKLQKTCTHDYQIIEKYSYNNHRFERCRKCQKTRTKEN
jgi:DNA-binding MarR family transcriptional regulator